MTTVDNRVVKMEFDNAQFEKGVAESIKSLKNMDRALNLDNGASGFEKVQSAANKISFKNVETEAKNMSSTVKDSVLSIASELGGIGSIVKKTAAGLAAIAPIAIGMAGGWSRALKIDEAKFKFQGLLGDVEDFDAQWKNLSADINYGVEGAAYGFDQAASAAAQLVASGIEFSQSLDQQESQMKTSLRAISGLTAMTGSSYEEISQIITSMAATGRVTNMDLERFATRSLKASATLAKALEVDEETLKKKVAAGEVDFMTFIKAMDDAYGEHAKEANKTLTGAISNFKAALSKIGALFADPIQHFVIDVANAIRPFINLMKDALQMEIELFDLAGNSLGKMSIVSSFIYNIEHLRDAIVETTEAFRGNETAVENFKRLFIQLNSAFDLVFHTIMEVGTSLVHLFDKVFTQFLRIDFSPIVDLLIHFVYETVDLLAIELECIGDILGLLMDAIADISEALSPAFKIIGSIIETTLGGALIQAFHALRWVTYGIKLIAEGINAFTNMLHNLADKPGSALNILVKWLTGLRDMLKIAQDTSALDAIGEAITNFMKAIGDISLPILDGFINILDALIGLGGSVIGVVIKDIADAVSALVKPILELVHIPNPFESLKLPEIDATGISNSLNLIADGIRRASAFLRVVSVQSFVRELGKLAESQDIKQAAANMLHFFDDIRANISKFFKDASEVISNAMDALLERFPALRPVVETISKAIDELGKIFEQVSNKFKTFIETNFDLSKITGALQQFGSAIKTFIRDAFNGLVDFTRDAFGDNAAQGLIDFAYGVDELINKIKELGGVFGDVGGKVSDFLGNFSSAKEDVQTITSAMSSAVSTATSPTKSMSGGTKRPSKSKPIWRDPETGQRYVGFPPSSNTESQGNIADKIVGQDQDALAAAKETIPVVQALSAAMATAESILEGFLLGLGQVASAIADTISNILGLGSTYHSTIFEGEIPVVDAAAKSFKKFGKAAEEADTPSIIETIGSKISELGSKISESVSSFLTFENVFKAISVAISGFMLGLTGKSLLNINKFTKGLSSLPKTLNGVLESLNLKQLGKAGEEESKIQQITKMLISFAIAIGALAASALLLSLVPLGSLAKASAVIVGFIIALVKSYTILLASMNNLKDAAHMKGNLIALSIALVALAGAVLTLSISAALLSLIPADRLALSAIVIVGFIMALARALEIMAKAEGKMLQAAGSVAILAIALNLLMVPVLFFALLPGPAIAKGLGVVVALMAGLAGLSYVFTKTGKQFLEAAGAVAILAVALNLLMVPILAFAILPFDMLAKGVLTVAAMMAGFAGLSHLISKEGKMFVQAGAGIAIMAAALGLLVMPITTLAMVATALPGGVLGSIAALVVMLGALTIALNAMKMDSLVGAQSLLLASTGLMALAAAIAMLSSVPFLAAIGGLVIFAGVLVALGVAAKLLTPMAAEIWVLSVSMLAFGGGLTLVGLGLTLVVSGLVSLAAVLPALAMSIVTTAGILLQPFADLASAAGTAIGAFIDSMVTSLSERIDSLKQGAATLVAGFADGITMAAGSVANSGIQLVLSFLGGVATKIGSIVESAVNIIVNFVSGIAANLGRIINSGIQLMASFISGIGKGLAQNRDALVGSFWDLLGGLGSLLLEFLASIVEKIPGVGPMMAEQIRGWANDVAPASEEVGEAYAEATTTAIEGASEEVGEEGTQAVADALEANADGTFDAAGQAAADDYGGSFGDSLGEMDFSGVLFGDASNDSAITAGTGAGEAYGEGAVDGVGSKETPVIDKVKSVFSSAGNVDSGNDGESVGNSFGSGMLKGVENYRERIVAKAKQVATEAKQGAKEAIDANSPSKDMIEIGGWVSQGVMIGIMQNTAGAVSAASSMATQSVEAVNDMMSQMDQLLAGVDWDAEPTIRPVFDGSDVERGIAAMNAMLPQSDVYSASMIGAGSRAFGTTDQSTQTQTNNTYNITLDWEAGMDANDMVMALSNALRTQTMMYA